MLEDKVIEFLKIVDARCNNRATPNTTWWVEYKNSAMDVPYIFTPHISMPGYAVEETFRPLVKEIDRNERNDPSGTLAIHYTYVINNKVYKFSHSNVLLRLSMTKECDVKLYDFLVQKSLTQLVLMAHKL